MGSPSGLPILCVGHALLEIRENAGIREHMAKIFLKIPLMDLKAAMPGDRAPPSLNRFGRPIQGRPSGRPFSFGGRLAGEKLTRAA